MSEGAGQPNILGIILIILFFIGLLVFLWKFNLPSDIRQM
jgi:membrane-bound ClpP family serine protease